MTKSLIDRSPELLEDPSSPDRPAGVSLRVPVEPSTISDLLADGPIVLPSLLLCDFGCLADEVRRLEDGGAKALHLDVMDGRFVPQLTYGPVVVEAVRRAASVPLEVHLMIEEPGRTLGDYATAGADILTVHAEALSEPTEVLAAIRNLGMLAHLAISPATPTGFIQALIEPRGGEACDGVLVMSVEPGYGGQKFMPESLEKIAQLSRLRSGRRRPLHLGIDGGISLETVGPAAVAGAEMIVAGSAVLRSDDYGRSIQELERRAREAA